MKGLEGDFIVSCAMVNMYAKCGLLLDAQDVFDHLSIRNSVSWTALIAGYAEQGLHKEVLRCLNQMQRDGIAPVSITFTCILKLCGTIKSLELGQEIHGQIVLRGLEKDQSVGNTLVDMYGKCGAHGDGQHVFNRLAVKDVVSWTTILNCDGGLEHASTDLQPNDYTFVALLRNCIELKDIEQGQATYFEIVAKGLECDHFVANVVMDMYSKCSLLEEARYVIDKLRVRDVISWNTMIAGYAEQGLGVEALSCFGQMQLEGLSPTGVTYACSLKGCGSIGCLEIGHEIHMEIMKRGSDQDPFVSNALVDMYAKCGSVLEGQCVFTKLAPQDVVCWNAMIKGYGENHECSLAVQCFGGMLKEGVKPNEATLTCLLTACSQSCLVMEGQGFFKLMEGTYGIQPTLEHLRCMVDLFARAGFAYDAEKFVESVHDAPSKEILIALLSACKSYGRIDLGMKCFWQLVQEYQEDGTAFLLMADMYASVGRLGDATFIQEMRKHSGAKKLSAGATLEANRTLHEFVVGDIQNESISSMIRILSAGMRHKDYIPNLDIVLSYPDENMEVG